MMSGSKAPDSDAYGLFRATHSHFYAPLRSVLNMCHWHIAPCPLFAYREAYRGIKLFYYRWFFAVVQVSIL